jgi:hypothetical protein
LAALQLGATLVFGQAGFALSRNDPQSFAKTTFRRLQQTVSITADFSPRSQSPQRQDSDSSLKREFPQFVGP